MKVGRSSSSALITTTEQPARLGGRRQQYPCFSSNAQRRISHPQVASAASTLYRPESPEQDLTYRALAVPSSLLSAAQQDENSEKELDLEASGVSSVSREDLQRLQSNEQASTSGSDAFGDPAEVFVSELKACEQLEDVMEMAIEESVSMDGAWIAAALLRCVSIVKSHRRKHGRRLQGVENGQALAVLLQLIQREASNMTAADAVMCLWSLATMNTKVLRVLKLLQRRIDVTLHELSEREMSLALWSFATLNNHPGVFADEVAKEAVSRIEAFKPQGLSMMMWAYGKLEHVPPNEFLGKVVSNLAQKLPVYSPQSIANIIHATGKLNYRLQLPLCKKVEAQIVQEPLGFKDIELANILFGFVRARFLSQPLVDILESRILNGTASGNTLAAVYGTLCWGCGVLGMGLKPETIIAMESWGAERMKTCDAQSASNIAWGLSKQGAVQTPVFDSALKRLVEYHEEKFLDPRLMRQLFQAVTTARLQGAKAVIPDELEQTAHKWWRKTSLSNTMSMTHAAVAKAVKALGLKYQPQKNAGYGLPTVDVAIERPNEPTLAIMVSTPQEFSLNDRRPLGKIVGGRKLLEEAGWVVGVINTEDLKDFTDEPHVISFVGKFLEGHGIQTSWKQCADSADKPAPPEIRSNRSRGSPKVPLPLSAQQKRASIEDFPDTVDDSEDDLEEQRVSPSLNGASSMGAVPVKQPAQNGKAANMHQAPYEVPKRMQVKRSFSPTVPGVRLESGTDLAARLDKKALEEDSPEEQRDRELKAAERRKYVASQLSGDFMDGWENLSNWKAAKKVQPPRRP